MMIDVYYPQGQNQYGENDLVVLLSTAVTQKENTLIGYWKSFSDLLERDPKKGLIRITQQERNQPKMFGTLEYLYIKDFKIENNLIILEVQSKKASDD